MFGRSRHGNWSGEADWERESLNFRGGRDLTFRFELNAYHVVNILMFSFTKFIFILVHENIITYLHILDKEIDS